MKNKRILITGACGFIGSHLVEKLSPDNSVVGVDNFYLAKREMLGLLDKKFTTFIEGDVARKETFSKIPRDIDFIIHLAAPSSKEMFKTDPNGSLTNVVNGAINTFEFAKVNEVEKVVYPSSGSIYARNELNHGIDPYPLPSNLYGASKVVIEAIASTYAPDVHTLGLRIFTGYGPGEERKKEIASLACIFAQSLLSGESPILHGDGMQSRDFIYIDDIVLAMIKAAEIGYTGHMDLGTGNSTTYIDLITMLCDIIGVDIAPTHIPKEKNYVEAVLANTAVMRKELGIVPLPIREGLERFVDYLKNKKS